MKIRFGANDVIDTQNAGAPENYEEVENAALDTQDTLDDGSTSYEDQTQLNLMKRLAKGFLAYLKGGSWADNYPKNALVAEFSDLANGSGVVPWAELEDAMVYDDKAEADEAGE